MIKAILFDLDGVLIDSALVNIRIFQELMAEFGFERPSDEYVASFFPLTGRQTVELLLPANKRSNKELLERMNERLREMVLESVERIPLFEGVQELLESLKGYKKGIVTNRRTITAMKFLEHYKIREFFDVVVTSDMTKNNKPHPEPVLLALAKLGVAAGEAVYVGDTLSDVQAGRAAKVRTLLVTNRKTVGAERINSISGLSDFLAKLKKGT